MPKTTPQPRTQIRTEEMNRLAENGIAVESWSCAASGRWRPAGKDAPGRLPCRAGQLLDCALCTPTLAWPPHLESHLSPHPTAHRAPPAGVSELESTLDEAGATSTYSSLLASASGSSGSLSSSGSDEEGPAAAAAAANGANGASARQRGGDGEAATAGSRFPFNLGAIVSQLAGGQRDDPPSSSGSDAEGPGSNGAGANGAAARNGAGASRNGRAGGGLPAVLSSGDSMPGDSVIDPQVGRGPGGLSVPCLLCGWMHTRGWLQTSRQAGQAGWASIPMLLDTRPPLLHPTGAVPAHQLAQIDPGVAGGVCGHAHG